MDVTTKAIALRATDYKENDKFILLYSLEYGKISVHARGVRKGSAKLKFAADQFCFGQYELAKKDDHFTLKTCEQIESFYSLREDVERYYSACVIAECLANFTEEGQADSELFIETLRALQALVNGAEPLVACLRYLLAFIKLSGFGLNLSACSVCGDKPLKLYLDFERGGLACDSCRTAQSLAVSPRAISACKMADGIAYDKLQNLSFTMEIIKDALTVLHKYVSHSFSPIKSLTELLKLS